MPPLVDTDECERFPPLIACEDEVDEAADESFDPPPPPPELPPELAPLPPELLDDCIDDGGPPTAPDGMWFGLPFDSLLALFAAERSPTGRLRRDLSIVFVVLSFRFSVSFALLTSYFLYLHEFYLIFQFIMY